MSGFVQDVRYALRQLRKSPGFAAVVVGTLALGIGANTAMFSVISAVLLKPLQYRDPNRVVIVTEGATPIRYEEMAQASRSYVEVGSFASGFENMTLSGIGEPEVLKGARVSSNFLRILGVNPLRGRSFLPEEDKPGAPPVAMISAELWQQRFGGDPLFMGKTVILAGVRHVIVGVLPPAFQFPLSGTNVWVTRPAEWSVLSAQSRPVSPILTVFGRLKPNVDTRHASAELAIFNTQYAAAHPEMLDAKLDSPEIVRPFKDELVSDVRLELWMLFSAVGFVLLIVCANVASLILARASSRSKEFAVRAAIGAGRGRIIRQLLAESIVLASVGGSLGVVLAALSLRAIRGMTFIDLPRAGEIRMDISVLGFAMAASILTGLLFGMAPALVSSRPDLAGVLRGSGEGTSLAGSMSVLRFSFRSLLVVGQIALSIALLIAATLLLESLAHVYRLNPGFRTANLLTMNVALSPQRYDTDEKKAAFYEQFVERAGSIPGIRSAAVTLTVPMTDVFFGAPVQVAGRTPMKLNERPISVVQNITPGYFRTLEIERKRGREFNIHDNAKSAPVAIIDERLARLFWPEYPGGPDPVGQYLVIGSDPRPAEIVGILADIHMSARDDYPRPSVYLPCSQKPPQSAVLVVRTDGNPGSFANEVRSLVLGIDPDQAVSGVATMDELMVTSEGQLNLMMRLLGTFALSATFLTAFGLYGAISYSVSRRTKEIGIRRALGAQPKHVFSQVVGQTCVLSLVGVALGLGAAFALTRFVQAMLFQVSATDPLTFAGIATLFVLIALAASYMPARRAAKLDPMSALRSE